MNDSRGKAARAFWTYESIAEYVVGCVYTSQNTHVDGCSAAFNSEAEWIVPPATGATLTPGATIDAREIQPGQIFFALPGERADGRRFLGQAAERGAGLAIVAQKGLSGFELPAGLPVLGVEDPAIALAVLAQAYRDALNDDYTRVIGVTGSNGKTTTVRLIDAALRGGGKRGTHAQKSFNNHLGLPLTLLNVQPGDDYVVCEMGTSGPGEIGFLTAIAWPDISVIVSIGRAHLEELGSVAGVAREKAMILRTDIVRGAGDIGILPAGVPELDAALDAMRAEGTLDDALMLACDVGTEGDPMWRIEAVCSDPNGTSFAISKFDTRAAYRVPLLGEHNAHNAAIAVAVAEECGVSNADIAKGLAGAANEGMRLDRRTIQTDAGPVTILLDAYNANPESMQAGLRTLGSIQRPTGGRRVAILGDVLEMGGFEAAAHQEIVDSVTARLASGELDAAVLLGTRFSDAAGTNRAVEHAASLWVIPGTNDAAIAEAAACVQPGDLVLVKASRGLRLERVVDALEAAGR